MMYGIDIKYMYVENTSRGFESSHQIALELPFSSDYWDCNDFAGYASSQCLS